MSNRNPTNVAASVHARLLNRARETGEDFQFLLHRYAAERLLYRLGCSPYRDRFVLKGAMLFAVWGGSVYRATRDLDFTGYGDASEETVQACFRDFCTQPVEDDGLEFDISTIRVEPILDDAEYNGFRVRFEARLGDARIPMQVDVGFGNAIEPGACDEYYPTLLDGPAPRIRIYPVEAVISEKLHAIHRFGETNSRMKDFYDLHVLSEQFDFDAGRLGRAIAATFERRATPIDAVLPAGLSPRFFAGGGRAEQWRAYVQRNRLPGAPTDFQAVGERLRAFFGPVWDALANGSAPTGTWRAGNGWSWVEPVPDATPLQEAMANASSEGATAVSTEVHPIPSPRAVVPAPLRHFKPYPAYRDSGIEWLGEIPAHWEVKRLSELASLINGYPFESEYFVRGEGIPLARIRDLNAIETEVKYAGPVPASAWIEPGDIIIGMDGDFNVARWRGPRALLNQRLCCLRPRTGTAAGFIAYLLPLPLKLINDLTYSTTVKHLSSTEVRRIRVGAPPEAEQRAIAAFLDCETAKIDALIAKKERLIELLQEKRTALITRAVTKGLDPNVPMKDSGVEWLGEIPAHWEVAPVYARYEVALGKMLDAKRVTGEFSGPYLRNVDVQWDMVNTEGLPEMDFAPWERDRYSLRPGDLLVCEGGEVGRTAMWRGGIEPCFYQKALHRVRPRANREVPRFFFYLMYMVAKRGVFAGVGNQNTIDHLTAVQLKHYRFPFAPEPEQRAIAAFLDCETAKIDALIGKIREAIECLREYRTALVSAAMTGKIDVRQTLEEAEI